jgi:sugar phosphate isomerase/epimerase
MSGNFEISNKKVDIKLAAMHLNWHIPSGDQFVPWLREVKEAGYEGITSFAHWGLEPFIERPQDLKQLLNDEGLALAAVDVRLHSNFEQYKPILEFMQAFDCNLMVCIDPAGTPKEYAKYGAMLNHIGGMAQEYQIYAHYHNHTDSVGETLSDVESLMKETDFSKVKLMLDIGHATKDFAELPPNKRAIHFIEKYWDRIHYLEFKDWNAVSDLNTPVGEGEADYLSIFKLIRDKGYAGWITVEQNGNDGLSLGRSAKKCAEISREYIKTNLGI